MTEPVINPVLTDPLPIPKKEEIERWDSLQRIRYCNNLRSRVSQGQNVTEEELALAVYAMRVERTATPAKAGKAAKEAKPQLSLDDL